MSKTFKQGVFGFVETMLVCFLCFKVRCLNRMKKWKQEKKKAAPMRAKSAYNYFVSNKLPELKTEFPGTQIANDNILSIA